MITRKSEVADQVLRAFTKLDKSTYERYILEFYQNWRETGYFLIETERRNKAVAFARYRNTDDIVVYYGEPNDFNMIGNIPSELVYKVKRFFQPGDVKLAAKFIFDYFKN